MRIHHDQLRGCDSGTPVNEMTQVSFTTMATVWTLGLGGHGIGFVSLSGFRMVQFPQPAPQDLSVGSQYGKT